MTGLTIGRVELVSVKLFDASYHKSVFLVCRRLYALSATLRKEVTGRLLDTRLNRFLSLNPIL
jgi:hypothetical protein